MSIVLWGLAACGDDAASADAGCAEPGERETCDCADGTDGTRLCLPGGALSECDCQAVRTLPCSAPGVAFACRCGTGRVGTEVCRLDGRYSACDCATDAASATDAAIPDPDPAGEPTPIPGCPGDFVCIEQMGVRACADGSGVPPLCGTDTDCAAAGLPDATCVDPMIGGVLVCYQPC